MAWQPKDKEPKIRALRWYNWRWNWSEIRMPEQAKTRLNNIKLPKVTLSCHKFRGLLLSKIQPLNRSLLPASWATLHLNQRQIILLFSKRSSKAAESIRKSRGRPFPEKSHLALSKSLQIRKLLKRINKSSKTWRNFPKSKNSDLRTP